MKKFFAVLAAVLTVIPLAGCALYGNDRSRTAYVQAEQTETEYIIDISGFTSVNKTLYIDRVTGGARIETGGGKQPEDYSAPEAAVLYGNDFPRRPSAVCAEGYEGLPEVLTARYETGKVQFIQYYAVNYGGTAYGFCNLYSSATGFLSGGGQIDAAKIVEGVYFSYDAEADTFTELERLEKCNIVATNTSGVIYFNDRKYYAKTADGEAKYICADEAYDTGVTNYSNVEFLFDAEYCIIIMHRGYNNYKKDYIKIVVTDYRANVVLSEMINGGQVS